MRVSWWLKGFAAFVGVNLLVAVPFAIVIACMPQWFEIVTIADDVVEIAVSEANRNDGVVNFCSSAELYDASPDNSGEHVFYGQFPGVFDLNAPAFFVRSKCATNIAIRSVKLVVGDLFSRTLEPAEILAAYCSDNDSVLTLGNDGMLKLAFAVEGCHLMPERCPAWGDWHFDPQGRIFTFCAFLFAVCLEVLMLMAIMLAAYRRRCDSMMRFHVGQAVLLAATVVFFGFYVVPLQSYYVNISDYPFGVAKLLSDIFPYSVVAFVVALVGLCLSEFVFGSVIHFVLFSFFVYEYLEVGVLSMDAPRFLGDLTYYYDLDLMRRDIIVLDVVGMVGIVLYFKLRKFFSWMLIAFFVMLAASLFDVGVDRRPVANESNHGKYDCARSDIPLILNYSPKRNIIVLVLDSVTSEVSRDIIEGSPQELAFDGFRAFVQNLGTQYLTDLSTVNIFTGEYYRGRDSKVSMHAHAAKASMHSSILNDYLNSPVNVFLMGPVSVFGHGYASKCAQSVSTSYTSDYNSLSWSPRNDPVVSISLKTLSLFRMSPFLLKPLTFRLVCPQYGFAEEAYIYPYFRKAAVKSLEAAFLYCHTWGAHIPHDVSASGARKAVPDASSYQSYANHAKAAFVELFKTLETFKAKGVYDCSTILIIADHGSHAKDDAKHYDERENALPPAAFPMLWVKPANSHGHIVFDEVTPTTHANLHKVLKALKDRDLTAEEIADMLRSDLRVFIRQTRDGYDQWDVGPDGAVISKKHIVVE